LFHKFFVLLGLLEFLGLFELLELLEFLALNPITQ
jgi:hypothetical protein